MSVILKHINSNWQLINPFDRSPNKTIDDLKDGEIESNICEHLVHVVEWDGDPPNIIKLTKEEINDLKDDFLSFRTKQRTLYREKCFLWAIDNESLKIVREKIWNVKRAHDPDYICHTNLTNGGMAYIAGEVLFGEDGNVYINYFSDRYGGRNTPEELWNAAKEIFKDLGYTNLIDLLEFL